MNHTDLVVALDPGNSHAGSSIVAVPDRARQGARAVPPTVLEAEVFAPRVNETTGLDFGMRIARHHAQCAARLGLVARLAVEEPPFKVRADVRHGSQAEIGYRLGVVSAAWLATLLPLAPTLAAPPGHVAVPVASWRTTMIALAPAWGAPVDAATAAQPVRTLGAPPVRWSVDHSYRQEVTVSDLIRVVASPCKHTMLVSLPGLEHLPTTCDQCEGEGNRRADKRAEDVTERWKRLAVFTALRIWPHVVEPLRDAARLRARTEKPDHQLVGVPDACEAIWLGVHTAMKEKP